MLTDEQGRKLKALLIQDTEETGKLLIVLDEERRALETTDGDKIRLVAQRKIESLQKIEGGSTDRTTLLNAAGATADNAGMQHVINQSPPKYQKELNTLWLELQTKLKECKTRNAINGTLVSGCQSTVHRLLQALRGAGKNETETVYGANGRTK